MEELKAKIEKANKEMLEAVNADNIELAKEKRSLIAELTKEIEDKKAEEELRQLKNQDSKENKKMEQRTYENSFKSLKEGKVISTRAIVVEGANTEAVLPEGFIAQVEKIREGYRPLKNDCDVYSVGTLDGRKPVAEVGGKLVKMVAGQKIAEGSVKYEQIKYSVESYGLIVAVDRALKEDAAQDIFGDIAEQFGESSVNTENETILKVMEDASTNLAIGSKDALDVIAEQISKFKPAVRAGVKIYVGSDLFAKFDNAKATDGHMDERITRRADGTLLFKGHEVVEVDETLFAEPSALGYVLNPKMIKFFDRKGIEIAMSSDVLFESNAEAIRVVERFDVQALKNTKLPVYKVIA